MHIFIVSTFTDGSAPPGSDWFFAYLSDAAVDFRMSKALLGGMRFAVFGLGDSSYGADAFNKPARRLRRALRALKADELLPAALGDENASKSAHGSLDEDFAVWMRAVWSRVVDGKTAVRRFFAFSG